MSTLKRSFSRKQIDIPHVSDIPASAKRGYLCRLSGRKILGKSDWKRKFFILYDNKLCYYDNQNIGGAEAGSGVINLNDFIDCVEAPVIDHKKATNVIVLLARERGFFDQGRYYLSADTLSEMKDWIVRIQAVLNKKTERRGRSERNHSMRRDTAITENLYASIKEASIHRSNSMSTIPSQHKEHMGGPYDWRNCSMDLAPLSTEDHNLTYSYSSSEESLSQPISITHHLPSISAESSLKRKEHQKMKNSPTLLQLQYMKYESVSTSPQLMKAYPSPLQSEKIFESCFSGSKKSLPSSRENTLSRLRSTSKNDSISSLKISENHTPLKNLNKMEQILRKATQQSEDLSKMFKMFEAESFPSNMASVGNECCVESILSNLSESIISFQSSIGNIETESKQLIKDIELTNSLVETALAESEREKLEFEKTRSQVEQLLTQLQVKGRKNTHIQHREEVQEYHTFPRSRQQKVGRDISEVVSEIEEDDGVTELYTQVRKSRSGQMVV